MTAVASPPSFHQPIPPRSSWTTNSSSIQSQLTPDEVSRLLMPPRSKSQGQIPTSQLQNHSQPHQQQSRPSSSASNSSTLSSGSTGSSAGLSSTSTPASSNPSPNPSEPNTPVNSATNTANSGVPWGKRKAARNGVGSREGNMKNSGNASSALNAAISNGIGGNGTGSYLMLLPLNGTFERKVIPLPFYPDVLRIGRQTNAKTVPTHTNGYFDSKVLSRQHAEVWAEKGSGRVYIRDVKSSNGTFVNGARLSPENRDSEPHEIRAEDILELGIDIVGEDNKTIVHHKVAARVQHAGFHQAQNGGAGGITNFDINIGDIDPIVGGGLMAPPMNHVQNIGGATGGRGRSNSQTSRGGAMAFLPNGIAGGQRQGGPMMTSLPITMENIVKRLNSELQQARQQSQELKRTGELFDMILFHKPQQPQIEEIREEEVVPDVNGEHPAATDATRESSKPEEPQEFSGEEKPSELPIPIEEIESLTSAKFPKNNPPSEILSLVTVLANTKRDLEAKSLRVRELEDSLLKERSARELAEGRIEKLELATFAIKGARGPEDVKAAVAATEDAKDAFRGLVPDVPDANEGAEKSMSPEPSVDNNMQLKLEKFMADVAAAKAEIESLKQSLQQSETEKSSAQVSLRQLVEEKRREEDSRIKAEKALETAKAEVRKAKKDMEKKLPNGDANGIPNGGDKGFNEGVMSKAMMTSRKNGARNTSALQQSAPYVSILGVVIIGVGLMAVLNSWQKGEKV